MTRLLVKDDIEPEFVEMVLNMLQQKGYFARLCTNFNNQAGVNTTTLSSVRLPLPLKPERQQLIPAMATARAERKAKLAEADALLAGIDDFLLNALGIAPPVEDARRVFAVRGQFAANRIDPHFHSPDFAQIGEMLSQAHCEPLGKLATLSKETWNPRNLEPSRSRTANVSLR